MRAIDLHTHSNSSDGSDTPAKLIEIAALAGLSAIALTDHDTVEGIDEALAAGESYPDLEVIPGIELSTEYEKKDIHIVGLYINHKEPAFLYKLDEFQDSRVNRNVKMCSLLQGAGIDITFAKLQQMFPDSVITRAHYARYLLAGGYVKSLPEAFDRYVGDHCKYYVPREKITPEQGIELILSAGGIPILAHPVLYRMSNDRLDRLVSQLKQAGLIGMECVYSTYASSEERDMKRLADKYGLLYSGGSDYHGVAKPDIKLGTGLSHLFVPEEFLVKIKEKAGIL